MPRDTLGLPAFLKRLPLLLITPRLAQLKGRWEASEQSPNMPRRAAAGKAKERVGNTAGFLPDRAHTDAGQESGWEQQPPEPADTDTLRKSMEAGELQSQAEDGLPALGNGVLGFPMPWEVEPEPLDPGPHPTEEELGFPGAAQRESAARRAKEAALETQLRKPHPGGNIWDRWGTGTTPFSHRLHHQPIGMFTDTVEEYHQTPSIIDDPIQHLNPSLQQPNPLVFLELQAATGAILGKLVFELFRDVVPRTVENFTRLCCGDPLQGELSYQDCRFHRVIPGFMMVSGDIVNGDGTGGKSVFGDTFPDESFQLSHVGPGILTMVNNGPDTNNSQFAILLARAEWLDGRNVVVGKLVTGYDLLRTLADRFGSLTGVPKEELYIGSCGINSGLS